MGCTDSVGGDRDQGWPDDQHPSPGGCQETVQMREAACKWSGAVGVITKALGKVQKNDWIFPLHHVLPDPLPEARLPEIDGGLIRSRAMEDHQGHVVQDAVLIRLGQGIV